MTMQRQVTLMDLLYDEDRNVQWYECIHRCSTASREYPGDLDLPARKVCDDCLEWDQKINYYLHEEDK